MMWGDMNDAPFKVGDRVRMKLDARTQVRKQKSYSGIVKKLEHTVRYGWWMDVLRDGCTSLAMRCCDDWELQPPADLSLDETACCLARAVLAGDNTAALALADRVFQMLNGG